MNLFYLDRQAAECARQHCDKHVVKMIIEYAQLLSAAHRILDGVQSEIIQNNRRKQVWTLPTDAPFYVASHVKHPDAIWCRATAPNYRFLVTLFTHLCDEYTHRYGRVHATDTKLRQHLAQFPQNIPAGAFTEPPQCMPDEYKAPDVVTAYQNLYVGSKARFAKWTNRQPPSWFIQRTANYDPSHFERTRQLAA